MSSKKQVMKKKVSYLIVFFNYQFFKIATVWTLAAKRRWACLTDFRSPLRVLRGAARNILPGRTAPPQLFQRVNCVRLPSMTTYVCRCLSRSQDKMVEDKTFGLKNKKKSKVVQKYVSTVTQTIKGEAMKAAEKAKAEKKNAKLAKMQVRRPCAFV